MENKEYEECADIAIIGMTGRFPGARDLEEFWENLRSGRNCISYFSRDDASQSRVPKAMREHRDFIAAKGVLSDIALFDANFFGFSHSEATILNPQARIFLECAWEALENASCNPDTYSGAIGIFAGASLNTYLVDHLSAAIMGQPAQQFHAVIGNDKDFLPSWVSYKLGLRGPCLNIQTACSTSLVTVHVACQSLIGGECDIALAGGVSVTLPQAGGYLYQEGGVLSRDGHCRPFDSEASGTVIGNGAGVVVLKRLTDAVHDGDCIHAVIKGSAINNDGRDKVSFTAPGVEGQAAVIRQALGIAQIDPETVTYIETHGTGTPLGDPIEVAALNLAYGERDSASSCALGALKANIGHLDAAAGVAGLIKAVLALKHKELPPNIHYANPNPNVDWGGSFHVNRECLPWHSSTPRRTGVSSFGIGGTNAHVILEEAPPRGSGGTRQALQLLVFSAKTPTALENVQHRLASHLGFTECALEDVAYTLQLGRKHHAYRSMLVCGDVKHATRVLGVAGHAQIQTGRLFDIPPKIVFMFPGQGTQRAEMGYELWQTEPVFAQHLDACCRKFEEHLGVDIRSVIHPGRDETPVSNDSLCETLVAQPSLFAIEYALAKLLDSWGIRPDAMIGHSLGEYVCACLAGVFSLDDAIRIVSVRATLMQSLPVGAMLAVALPVERVRTILGDTIAVASINADDQCVISGTQEVIDGFASRLRSEGIYCDQLNTSRAFHSDMVTPAIPEFEKELAKVQFNPPAIPFISNVTGTWITPAEAGNSQYWLAHLKSTVQFSKGLGCVSRNAAFFLELGPGRTLSNLARRHKQIDKETVSCIPVLPGVQGTDDSERHSLLHVVGRLWLAGVEPCWHEISSGQRVPLPTYPFERTRCWPDHDGAEPAYNIGQNAMVESDDAADWLYTESWRRSSLPGPPLLKEGQRWLIFLDRVGVGEEIAMRLRTSGCSVVIVELADNYKQVGESHYCIPNADRSHYESIIASVSAKGWLPDRILHLFSLVDANAEFIDFDGFQERGFYSLLALSQALVQCTHQIDILVGTARLCLVSGEENVLPELATLLGLAAVLPHENRNLGCRLIDLGGDSGLPPPALLVERLLQESSITPAGQIVAYRGSYRWERTYERFLPGPTHVDRDPIKKNGTYLVIGGLGKIGQVVTEMLVQSRAGTVVLTTRKEFPKRADWLSRMEEKGGGNATTRIIRRLLELERGGCRIMVRQLDIRDEAKLSSLFENLETFDLTPHGVFVTAGVEERDIAQMIESTSRENCKPHFEVKVGGLYALSKILASRPLDFVVLPSSLASSLGGMGLAAYAASNSFVDIYAEIVHREADTPWLTINWDGWNFENAPAAPSSGLSPVEGGIIFKMLLGRLDAGRVLVSKTDLNKRRWLPKATTDGIAGHAVAPLRTKNFVAPSSELEQCIAAVWEKILGVKPIGIHDDFFELGGHSLLATQVISELRDALNIDIPLRKVFEIRTVAELSLLVEEIFVSELEALQAEESNE